jgi:ATP phosphoribosyltransferase regulatory subunit HisZ
MKPSPRQLFEAYGFTRIRTPLLQPYETLQRNIHPDYHGEMVKIITPKGDIAVLRYDNTLSALEMMLDQNLEKIYTAEPVYRSNLMTQQIEERHAMSVEVMRPPSITRDADLLTLALEILKAVHGDTFIFEVSLTEWLNALLEKERCLLPLQSALEVALTKKNPVALKMLLEPIANDVEHYEDLVFALTAHGAYKELLLTLKSNAYAKVLEPLLSGLEQTLKDLPQWAMDKLYLDLAYPPKLSHYAGLTFQALSLTSNTCLASGGAYLYSDSPQDGIGFILYFEEDQNVN